MNGKIKNVYDEIHAPEALLGKVMEMKKDEFKKRAVIKYIAAAVLALVLTVVASNGICYAATGETWIGKIKILVNGVEQEHDITWEKDGDLIFGIMEIEVEEGEPLSLEMVTDAAEAAGADSIEDVVILAVHSFEEENEEGTESDTEGDVASEPEQE